MAIFYIGGSVSVDLYWSLSEIPFLVAVDEEDPGECGLYQRKPRVLQCYQGENFPGQPWGSFRTLGIKKTSEDKNLNDRLIALLQPSTTQAQLDQLQANRPQSRHYCAYLRTKEKRMDPKEWLQSNGLVPNGAHFPLFVITKNAGARSEESDTRRREKYMNRNKGKDKGKGKGRGKGKDRRQDETAVAERQGKDQTAVAEREGKAGREGKGLGVMD